MKLIKKVTYIIVALAMVITLLGPCGYELRSKANQTGTILGDFLRLRETPDGAEVKDVAGNNIYLRAGTKVDIVDTSNSTWYLITVNYNGQSYTGYSAAQYISIDQAGDSVYDPNANVDFETKLSNEGFPESYKVKLRELHAKYPSWEFKAVHTGLDWNQVVAGEVNSSSSVKNLVQGTGSLPRYSWRSITVGYNYKTDTWTPYDGYNWYAASDELIAYYLDPRTYMYENYIFVFESLSYVEGMQTEAGVEAILSGTFMSNTIPAGETLTYAQLIVEAGKNSGVSPYHIASRIKQEMGASGNVCAFGTSEQYPNIYNFYNIGAYDGTDAATKGLAWAATEGGSYGRPWNTPYKSILGGAQFLGTSYINVKQNTLYTQKFNVTNTSCLFSHQYMTNVQAPSTEALHVYEAYINNNLLNSSLVFEIPVYTNMPETATNKPADAGNPNNWLASLTVDGYVLTPAFDVNLTTEYSLNVSENISSINISASTVNKNARVDGAGTISLTEGTNVISLVVTAQNGNVRTYNITVNRGGAGSGSTVVGNSVGDLNGDSTINYKDIVKIQRIIMGLEASSDQAMLLGDINKDGIINYKDIVKVQRHIMGLELIQ
ncbi:MAG: cadherin-like beta sandwich domain-containing protein [Lachnospiraceae bacterium]|nr:cadherin-like beta sandwich domain-containing protein [Lachnospiraceae bacterium]